MSNKYSSDAQYHIGLADQAWGLSEKQQWLNEQTKKRSYADDVERAINGLASHWSVDHYAHLDYKASTGTQYPLYVVRNKKIYPNNPYVLITGGVHGYETSGVMGAIAFLQEAGLHYLDNVNFIVFPCVSPWGYETINRWNPNAHDPNRHFTINHSTPETSALISYLAKASLDIKVHIDLHETTDTDNSEFRPALGARDGKVQDIWQIPDGFYLVGDTHNSKPEFQKAIINAVKQVTHIAPSDASGKLIGVNIEQEGVINYDVKKLHLCAGLTNADYVTTTEVYPDSVDATPSICIAAQIAAIKGGLDYFLSLQHGDE